MHEQERRGSWFSGWMVNKMHIQASQLKLEMVEIRIHPCLLLWPAVCVLPVRHQSLPVRPCERVPPW